MPYSKKSCCRENGPKCSKFGFWVKMPKIDRPGSPGGVEKPLRNGLSLSEMDPLNHKILRFSRGWHYISFKKNTVKNILT
jgi:hypothetical protein